jgi:hypothetical protein
MPLPSRSRSAQFAGPTRKPRESDGHNKEAPSMFDPKLPETAAELWRVWTDLEEADLAINMMGLPPEAERRRSEALNAEIDELRKIVERRPIRSFEDVALALDIVLQYEAEANKMAGDRVLLDHLVRELRHLAPSTPMGTIARRALAVRRSGTR